MDANSPIPAGRISQDDAKAMLMLILELRSFLDTPYPSSDEVDRIEQIDSLVGRISGRAKVSA